METGNKSRVWLGNRTLYFQFPEVHPQAQLKVNFFRTLRVPDDDQAYPLPAGLDIFPLLPVEDYRSTAPESLQRFGGIMFPMYQTEAMWINLNGSYPMAVKIATGKVNAVTGGPWQANLQDEPQDYVTTPDQRWLDGYCTGEGRVRQFVAMPLGQGFTAEEQITGSAEFGGLQLQICPMKRAFYDDWKARTERVREDYADIPAFLSRTDSPRMGFAPGGQIEQIIEEDPHGVNAWDQQQRLRCFAHVINSADFKAITGRPPPLPPTTKKQYEAAGIPWYRVLHKEEVKALHGSGVLAKLKSLRFKSEAQGVPLFDERTITCGPVELISDARKTDVADQW